MVTPAEAKGLDERWDETKNLVCQQASGRDSVLKSCLYPGVLLSLRRVLHEGICTLAGIVPLRANSLRLRSGQALRD
jgi:hypothetical protein